MKFNVLTFAYTRLVKSQWLSFSKELSTFFVVAFMFLFYTVDFDCKNKIGHVISTLLPNLCKR